MPGSEAHPPFAILKMGGNLFKKGGIPVFKAIFKKKGGIRFSSLKKNTHHLRMSFLGEFQPPGKLHWASNGLVHVSKMWGGVGCTTTRYPKRRPKKKDFAVEKMQKAPKKERSLLSKHFAVHLFFQALKKQMSCLFFHHTEVIHHSLYLTKILGKWNNISPT